MHIVQRKSWSHQEDLFIEQKVRENEKLPQKDHLKWGDIADQLNALFPESKRSGKQCRQRWHNQLDPNITHQEWSRQQERKLFELQKQLGNKWAVISSKLQGRTDNNVKNYFYSTLRKSLRKLNSFISVNRGQLKNAKEFKKNSLSKLLAVADHKFDKKINIKKLSAQEDAIEIKNMLIEIINVEITDFKSRNLFITLVRKLQEWNKCCKKKKPKRKQEEEKYLKEVSDQSDGVIDEENQDEEEDQQDEQEKEEEKRKKSPVSNWKWKTVKKPHEQRSRSRNNKKIQKKNSNISKSSKKSKGSKKQPQQIHKNNLLNPQTISNNLLRRQQSRKSPYRQKNLSRLPSIPQAGIKISSRSYSNSPSNRTFMDLARSSLDLGRLQKKQSTGSQLFKSFLGDVPQIYPNQKRQSSFCSRMLRSNSNAHFLNMIREVSLVKNESQQSGINELLQEDNVENDFYMKMLRRQSSRKEIPFLKDESSYWNTLYPLDQSWRLEPQISKLRSFRRESSNFQLGYKFGEGKRN